jgi:RNA polymerase primary sigma factor
MICDLCVVFTSKSFPKYLPREEQMRLIARAQKGDVEARNRMVETNMGLVFSVAEGWTRDGVVDLKDLLNEGALGLMEAIGRFDASRGLSFSTYAIWYVRKCIRNRFTSDKSQFGGSVRTLYNKGNKFIRAVAAARQAGAATEADAISVVAREMRCTEKTIRIHIDRMRITFGQHPSLDAVMGVGDTECGSFGDIIADEAAVSVDEFVIDVDLSKKVRKVIASAALSDRERAMVKHRLLQSDTKETLADYGRRFGICRERARQIEVVLLPKLRKLLVAFRDVSSVVGVPPKPAEIVAKQGKRVARRKKVVSVASRRG